MSITNRCFCGAEAVTTRCSQLRGSSLSRGVSCGGICDKLLPCGFHRCTDICHEGDCAPCQRVVRSKCYCGKHEKDMRCGDGLAKTSSESADLSWEGRWACASLCERPFDVSVCHMTVKMGPKTDVSSLHAYSVASTSASAHVMQSASNDRRAPFLPPLSQHAPVVPSPSGNGRAVRTRSRHARAPAVVNSRVATAARPSATSETARPAPSSCRRHVDVARQRNPSPATKSSAKSQRVAKKFFAPPPADRCATVVDTSAGGHAVRCTFWQSQSRERSLRSGSSRSRTQPACTTATCRAEKRSSAGFTTAP